MDTMAVSWNNAAKEYATKVENLSAPYVEQAIGMFPSDLPKGPICVAGVGPGRELGTLTEKFPDREIAASDIAREMLTIAARQKEKLPNPHLVTLEECNLFDIPENSAALATSFFLTHVMPDPKEAAIHQLNTVKRGGILGLLYFPPEQEKRGPLFALRNAVSSTLNIPAVIWEEELIQKWKNDPALTLQVVTFTETWQFHRPEEFRGIMEVLPQMDQLKKKISEDQYEKIWRLWQQDTGMITCEQGVSGLVAARFILVRKKGAVTG